MGLSDAAPPASASFAVFRRLSPSLAASPSSTRLPRVSASASAFSVSAALDASPARAEDSAARRARSCIARLFSAKYSSSRITCVSSSYANAHGSPPGPRCHRVFSNVVRDARGGAGVFSRGSASKRRAETSSVLSAVPSIAVPSIASSIEYAPPRLYAPTHSVTYRAAVFSSHRFASRSAFTVRIFVAHPRAVSSSTRSNTRSTSASYAARASVPRSSACLRSERYRTTRAG